MHREVIEWFRRNLTFSKTVLMGVCGQKTLVNYSIFQSPNIVSSLPPSACKAFPLLSFDLLNVLSFGRRHIQIERRLGSSRLYEGKKGCKRRSTSYASGKPCVGSCNCTPWTCGTAEHKTNSASLKNIKEEISETTPRQFW